MIEYLVYTVISGLGGWVVKEGLSYLGVKKTSIIQRDNRAIINELIEDAVRDTYQTYVKPLRAANRRKGHDEKLNSEQKKEALSKANERAMLLARGYGVSSMVGLGFKIESTLNRIKEESKRRVV